MSIRQMNFLASLNSKLSFSFETVLKRTEGWTDPAATERMIEKVRDRHDGPARPPDPSTIAVEVSRFCRTGVVEGWRSLKRICYGAGLFDSKGFCILSDKSLRDSLLALAQEQESGRKRVKCYQSLLSSYFGFRLSEADEKAKTGWIALRTWLDSRLSSVETDADRKLGWLDTLILHRNLLKENPCVRYGPKLLQGDDKEVRHAFAGLGIPSHSWVHEETVIALIRAATLYEHERFRTELPELLSMATGMTGVVKAKSLKIRSVSLLVSRYAKVPGRPEHTGLRDAAVHIIGNPWLRRASWDAAVVDERGRPDNNAREMVNGWLKVRLITDFFELLSEDGIGDTRRLKYWLRFEPFINDMWFALGSTRYNRGENFKNFLSRARGRLLNLEYTSADNNAFIMRMGEHVAVEFGKTGHAFYMFRWDDLPKEVVDKLLSGKERVDVTVQQLKSSGRALFTKPHRDSPVAMESWEQKFDAEICPIINKRPEKRPAFVPVLEDVVAQYRVNGEDWRPRGGALWILADNSNSRFNDKLKELGFNYRPGKGWWKE